ncbi:oligosaccharide flippase family protein, partial [bacterium]|nr:oligosaccharide flippase family protein [bacterium]
VPGGETAPAAPAPAASESGVPTRRLVSFSLSFYAYDLLNFVLDKSLDIWMLMFLVADTREVGWYAIAYNFAFFALTIFTKVFAEGFTLGLVADVHASGDRERLQRVFGAIFEYVYLFALPIAFGGLVLGDDLLRVMYGAEAKGAIAPALLFLVVMTLGRYQSITANFLGAMDSERALIRSRAIFGAMNFAANLALIPKFGALGAAIGTSVATVAGLAYEARLLHLTMRPRIPWRFFRRVAGCAAAMAAAVVAVCHLLPDSDNLRVLAGLPAGAIVYVIGLRVTRPISPHLLELIGRMRWPAASAAARWLMPAKGSRP